MIGERPVDQGALFFEFSLERHVPVDHLLRAIDRFVDLGDLRAHLASFYSDTGRPSIDPELLIRMLLVGYCHGSGQSGGSVRKFTSIWLTGGSAGWGWMALSPTIRPSPRTGMAASVIAICCGTCSRRYYAVYDGRVGWRRRFCRRCQPDQGRRQPSKRSGRIKGAPAGDGQPGH